MKKVYALKTLKKESSKQWMRRHLNDPYVRRARQEKYRCRSSFKLEEILTSYPLISPGMRILDLGCAPGGWSQVVQKKIKNTGCLVGVDLLSIHPLNKMIFIQGDIQDKDIQDQIRHHANDFDVIISDIAHSLTGHAPTDRLQMETLIETVWNITQQFSTVGSCLIMKIFHGNMAQSIVPFFEKVRYVKPAASRSTSREIYLVGQNMKKQFTNNGKNNNEASS